MNRGTFLHDFSNPELYQKLWGQPGNYWKKTHKRIAKIRPNEAVKDYDRVVTASATMTGLSKKLDGNELAKQAFDVLTHIFNCYACQTRLSRNASHSNFSKQRSFTYGASNSH